MCFLSFRVTLCLIFVALLVCRSARINKRTVRKYLVARRFAFHELRMQPRGNDDGIAEPTNPNGKSIYIFERDSRPAAIDPYKFVLFNALALLLALGANFLGITSTLMSNNNPDFFRSMKFDQLYAIGNMRRYVDNDDGFQLVIPQDWEMDNRILREKVKERDMPGPLRNRYRERREVLPSVAFAPQGNNPSKIKERLSKTTANVSVIKSKIMEGFSLGSTLGAPEEAARKLLGNIATANSGKVFDLINAREDVVGGRQRYIFEYVMKRENEALGPVFAQHGITVVIGQDATGGSDDGAAALFTCTVVAPESDWLLWKENAEATAKSFTLTQ